MTALKKTMTAISFDPKKLAMAVAGDIHLGHHETPTEHILRSLTLAFPDNAETGKLDIIFLEGDVFDRLLTMPEDPTYEIRAWVAKFLKVCKRWDIVLRVLEGTPSHDWKQSRIFTEVNELAGIGCDCKYVDKLSIETIERFNATVLYVPDEWKPEPDQVWQDVQECLALNGLEKVDYAIMHGYFPHQLPAQLAAGAHDPEKYLSIVRNEIFIGHVHNFTQRGRIIAAGSLDRLSHGDENDKGHVRRTEKGITFVINENAKKYITVDCRGLDSDKAHELVKEKISSLPDKSAVRIRANKSDAFATSLTAMKELYPQFTWKIKTDDDTDKQPYVDIVDLRTEYTMIRIDRDNIIDLMRERIMRKHTSRVQSCMSKLEETVTNYG